MVASSSPLLWCTPRRNCFSVSSPNQRSTQVQPGGAGGREVNLEAGPLGEPVPDQRRLVGGVVVRNQVHLQPGGHLGTRWHRGTCGTPRPGGGGGIGQSPGRSWRPTRRRGTWCRGARNHGCAAPPGPGAGATAAWCGPGPESGLLVHAQDQRPVRRIKVESHNVPHLFNEEGVRRQLEGFRCGAVAGRRRARCG